VYVLNNNNENLKMSKYIPKVGEAFEFYSDVLKGWYDRTKVLLITDKEVVYLGDNGRIAGLCLTRTFRPIQTKADVEREQLIDIVRKHRMLPEGRVELIQQAGFTIPKKIKRSELKKIINHHHSNSAVGYTKTVDILICKLLGDLVEQDKGGAE
jgi:hypothetical protein